MISVKYKRDRHIYIFINKSERQMEGVKMAEQVLFSLLYTRGLTFSQLWKLCRNTNFNNLINYSDDIINYRANVNFNILLHTHTQ